jgi:hypothetical protein
MDDAIVLANGLKSSDRGRDSGGVDVYLGDGEEEKLERKPLVAGDGFEYR